MNSDYFLAIADNEFWPHQQAHLRELDRLVLCAKADIDGQDVEQWPELLSILEYRINMADYWRKLYREMMLEDFQVTFGVR